MTYGVYFAPISHPAPPAFPTFPQFAPFPHVAPAAPRLAGPPPASVYPQLIHLPFLGAPKAKPVTKPAPRDPLTKYTTAQMRKLALKPSRQFRIPVPFILALAKRESGFKPFGPPSTAGAEGLMQILPNTGRFIAKFLGQPPKRALLPDWQDPAWNVRAGTFYYSVQLKRFKDWRDALVAYVAGPARAEEIGGYNGANAKIRSYVDDIGRGFVAYGGNPAWLKKNTRAAALVKRETNEMDDLVLFGAIAAAALVLGMAFA